MRTGDNFGVNRDGFPGANDLAVVGFVQIEVRSGRVLCHSREVGGRAMSW